MKIHALRFVVLLAAFFFQATGHAAQPGEKYTFVLVHGATAGGWEWKSTGKFLTDDGHTVYRATLTGLGEREHLNSPDVDLPGTHVAMVEDPRGVATLIEQSVNDKNKPVAK